MTLLNVRLWIWIYLLLSFFGFNSIIIWWYREKIKRKYYIMRFPEKIIRVFIHYKTGLFHEFWRLMPTEDTLELMNNAYIYDSKKIIKADDIFISEKEKEYKIKIDKKEYNLLPDKIIKNKHNIYQEIHYFFNNPAPLDFYSNVELKTSASDLNIFQENDLFRKLMTLSQEKGILLLLMILVIANLLGTIFIILKITGVLD
jgi:hypothetical protein